MNTFGGITVNTLFLDKKQVSPLKINANSIKDKSFESIINSKMTLQKQRSEHVENNAPKFKSFKEASANKVKVNENQKEQASRIDSDEDQNKKCENNISKKSSNTYSEETIAIVASMLGLSQDELNKLMQDHSSGNINKISSNKIEDVEVPTEEPKETNQIQTIRNFVSELKAILDEYEASKSIQTSIVEVPTEAKVSDEVLNSQITNNQDQALKDKLNELMQKLGVELKKAGLVDHKAEQLLKHFFEPKVDVQTVKSLSEDYSEIMTEKQELEQEAMQAAIKKSQDKQAGLQNSDGQAGKDAESFSGMLDRSSLNQSITAATNTQDTQFQIIPTSELKSVHAPTNHLPINLTRMTQAQVMNQIMDKAKVLAGAEKAEMMMELKPESLGKLSLKVVTEQGMVMAKFTAESEQVKQVIEANFQLLKDALEKQGMNIQGFSVSVRQDSSEGNNSQKQWFTSRNSRNRSESNEIGGIAIAGTQVSSIAESLYNLGGNSVDFTA